MEILRAWLVNGLRTAVVAMWGFLLAKVPPLAALVATLTPDQQSGLQLTIATALAAFIIGGLSAGLHWAGTRVGDQWWNKLARGVAAVVMLGLNRFLPTYAPGTNRGDLTVASVRVREVGPTGEVGAVVGSIPPVRE